MNNLKFGLIISFYIILSWLVSVGLGLIVGLGYGSIILQPFLAFFIQFKVHKILINKNEKKIILKGIFINLISSFFTLFLLSLIIHIIEITRCYLFNENNSFDWKQFINHIIESVLLIFFIQSFIWLIVCLIKYKKKLIVEESTEIKVLKENEL
jgi:hypothetical protein